MFLGCFFWLIDMMGVSWRVHVEKGRFFLPAEDEI